MKLFNKKKVTIEEEFLARESMVLEQYKMLQDCFALVGEEQVLANAVWKVRTWLKPKTERTDDEILIAARTSVTTAIGFICEVFGFDPSRAATYIAENPGQILHVMKMATAKAVNDDPSNLDVLVRTRQYFKAKHA